MSGVGMRANLNDKHLELLNEFHATFPPRQKNSAAASIFLGLLLVCSAALAKQSDRDKPMNVDARSGNLFMTANSKTTISGDVKIVQGTLKITGSRADLYSGADGSNIVRAVIFGTPAHIQQLDDNGNLMTGDASKLDYDNVKGIAVLTGNAVVKQQGRGEAHGDKLTYNTTTSQMTGESQGDNRLHMVFQPKKKTPSAAAVKPSQSTSEPAPASSASTAPAPAASTSEQP